MKYTLLCCSLAIPAQAFGQAEVDLMGTVSTVAPDDVLASPESEEAGGAPDAAPTEASSEPSEEVAAEEASSWDHRLSVGSSASLNYTSRVIGIQDGQTVQIGALLSAGSLYTSGKNKLNISLDINEAVVRTELVDRWIPNIDTTVLDLLYSYSVTDRFGPYVNANAATKLFDGFLVLPADYSVTRLDPEGNLVSVTAKEALTSITINKPFDPLTLKQSAGAFYDLGNRRDLNLVSRAGFGAQQILGGQSWTIDAQDVAAQTLVLRQTNDNISQLGPILALSGDGEVTENVTWKASVEGFYPVVDNSGYDYPTPAGRVHYTLDGNLTTALSDWASLTWGLGLRKLPSLQKNQDTQVLGSILFTTNFNVVE